MQNLRLYVHKIGLNRGSAADTPQQGCKSEDELAFDRRLGIVIGGHGCFECPIVLNVLQRDHNSFGGQAMPDSIVPRPPFAVLSLWAGAAQRIAPIGFDLSERSHPLASPPAFWGTKLSCGSAAGGRLESGP
jgi:hypothetical protein